MARGDRRHSPKMSRIKAQKSKKARAKRAAVAAREARKG